MVNYPYWWDKDITIYHQYKEKGIIKWSKYFYSRCFYGNAKKQAVSGMKLHSNDYTIVRIPYKNDIVLNKNDIVVFGNVSDILEAMDSGNNLMAKYPESFAVNTVKYNIAMKNTPHIYGSS